MAICDEMGTVFIDARDISMDKISQADNEVCPFCQEKSTIRPAKDIEIIAIGLTPQDYE